MTEKKKFEKTLGLPPMELAETTTYIDRESSLSIAQKCFHPWLKRVIGTIILTTIAVVSYIVLLRILQSADTSRTEVIVVTNLQGPPNITIAQQNLDIFIQLKNKTSNRVRRKRRFVNNKELTDVFKLHDEAMKKAREIIVNHNEPCTSETKDEVCKNLVKKLESVSKKRSTKDLDGSETSTNNQLHEHLKSNINAIEELEEPRNVNNDYHSVIPIQHPTPVSSPSTISDSCLLARLLKQNMDYFPGYLSPSASPNHQIPLQYHSYLSPPYPENRFSVNLNENLQHPQDIEIMRFHTPQRPAIVSKHSHALSRDGDCPLESMSCEDGINCIAQKRWCDGIVDCADASDEARCSCKDRVDESRLCDGYFDCPFGEDEMECFGCTDGSFSCEDFDLNTRSTCFTREQRCDNIVDCPNHKDEIECNLLAPSFHDKPMFAVSNTEGFLHRNYRGTWFPVCNNPYMWAHDACRRETGLIIRPPYIQMVPIDPSLNLTYLNTGQGGTIEITTSCINSSAVFVTCPDLLCGTRVPTTSHFLKKNAAYENYLFGRNKRYNFQTEKALYPKRMKRFSNTSAMYEIGDFDELKLNSDLRVRRTETRVVGGRPSQPAAWPWMVAMYRNGMFHCGGVVISQRWIVSAAHCVHKFWENHYEIQVGMLRRFSFSPQESNLLITHVIVNHKYDRNDMKNDLSLLRVKPAIQFSRWVRPICLPGPDTAGPDWMWGPATGTMCMAVGWGSTVEHGPDPDHMREVEVPIWSQCKHSEDRAGKEICAGLMEGGKDACQGDSGGPLLCRNPLNAQQWYMAGIVSHGDGCGRRGEPGVYTRVSMFSKWIKHHIFSQVLPGIQPKQECPGFKCVSGISKCLPKKRVCDKIIDCLDGEDEMNCNNLKSVPEHENNLFLTDINFRQNHFETKEAEEVKDVLFDKKLTDIKSEPLSKEKHGRSEETHHIMSLKPHKNKTVADNQETTVSTSSTEQFSSSSEENTTDDPLEKDDEIDRGDIQSVTVTDSDESLESKSIIVTEDAKVKSEQMRDMNITENFENNFSTTTLAQTETLSDIKSTSIVEHFENKQITTTRQSDQTMINTISIPFEKHDSTITSSDNNESSFIIKTQLETTTVPFENESSFNNSIKESKTLLIELPFDDNDKLSINHNTTLSDKVISKSEEDDIIDKMNTINSMKFSPAKFIKRHRIPSVFECGRIKQIIPYEFRCNNKADCEDGTDELDCSCVNYLTTFDEKLICDGVVDCAEGQDELNCYGCPEEEFLCKKSNLCMHMKYVCNGKRECPHGEDEVNCYTLSNGKNIEIDFDGKPRISLEGYITKKHGKSWNVICEDNLSVDQQEEAASQICRYLGLSFANRFHVKYVSIKEEEILETTEFRRHKRHSTMMKPISFAYRKVDEKSADEKHLVIRNPQIIKEQCVPNITKTCQSLYVSCAHTLYDDFSKNEWEDLFSKEADTKIAKRNWPWIAKVFVEGHYKCTGILIDLSWVLVSQTCLWDVLLFQNYVSVVLGSQRTLRATYGPYEQIYQVDGKKDFYHVKVTLLHLKEPAHYSNMVKPMVLHSYHIARNNKDSMCFALGQDDTNNTISVYLEETEKKCDVQNKCFVRISTGPICSRKTSSYSPWAGIVACHGPDGWYPSASFVEANGECGLEDTIVGIDLENLKMDMKHILGKPLPGSNEKYTRDNCDGIRCARGRCVKFSQLCNHVSECEDGRDESPVACEKKKSVCLDDPHYRGCECSSGQLKCKNGSCISKELFGDGKDDCGDGSDEPGHVTCAQYLARVMPLRLCDGILHCADKTDEDPSFCKCFSKISYKCAASDHCVSPDMVCDGTPDCPNKEDETTCLALSAPEGTPYGTGEVIVRSYGVWHSKCYSKDNFTRSELENICRELGFISGHAKQLGIPKKAILTPRTKVVLESFNEITLNNSTSIKLRNNDNPLARVVVDENSKNCHPVFIECL